MSRLDELIQQHCPDGVEYRTLDKCCDVFKGEQLNKDLLSKELSDDKPYAVINGGKNPSGYWHMNNQNADTITISQGGASAGFVDYQTKSFWAGAHCYVLSNCKDDVVYKYLYYNVKQAERILTESQYGGGIPALAKKDVENLEIPVPPLPVQEEIVRILDKFTELEQELEQELELRKKQYEYYRDKMLSLSDYDGEVEYVELNTIADVKDGTHDSPKPSSDDDTMYLLTSKNVKNGIINYDGAYRISKKDYDAINQRSKVDIFDLLFTMIGTVGEIGLVSDIPDYAIKNVGLIKTNGDELLSKFLRYYLTTSMANQYINANKSKGSQVFLSLGKLRAFPVPKIDEDVMREIVEKLDKFSTLTSDISEGLPAEIKMRHQQYEYYRDKLLNFKRLEVA